MSFFDNENIDNIEQELIDEFEKERQKSLLGKRLGDIVIYNKLTKSFDVYKPDYYEYKPEFIIMGVILHEYDDMSVDVLSKGFLTNEPIKIPFSYFRKDKIHFLPVYIKDLFNRYVKALKKKSYNSIEMQSLQFRFPTIQHLNNIVENIENYENSFNMIFGEENANKFLKRFKYSPIFITYNKKYS